MAETKSLTKIILRTGTGVSHLTAAVEAAIEATGHVECDIDSGITWIVFLLSHGIIVDDQHLLKSSGGTIVTGVYSKVSDHIRKFKITRSTHVVKIEQPRGGRPSANDTASTRRVKKSPTAAPPPPGISKRGRPRKFKESKGPSPKIEKVKRKVKPRRQSTPKVVLRLQDEEIPGPPLFSNDFGSPKRNYIDLTDDQQMETASQCSQFTLSSQDDMMDVENADAIGFDIKGRIVDCVVRNLDNKLIMNMKKEVDNLKQRRKWMKMLSYMPNVGLLLGEIFANENFNQ